MSTYFQGEMNFYTDTPQCVGSCEHCLVTLYIRIQIKSLTIETNVAIYGSANDPHDPRPIRLCLIRHSCMKTLIIHTQQPTFLALFVFGKTYKHDLDG